MNSYLYTSMYIPNKNSQAQNDPACKSSFSIIKFIASLAIQSHDIPELWRKLVLDDFPLPDTVIVGLNEAAI